MPIIVCTAGITQAEEKVKLVKRFASPMCEKARRGREKRETPPSMACTYAASTAGRNAAPATDKIDVYKRQLHELTPSDRKLACAVRKSRL